MLIIDAFAASGSGPAVKVLMENIKNKKITNERAATVFMTLANNLNAPALVKDIVVIINIFYLNDLLLIKLI